MNAYQGHTVTDHDAAPSTAATGLEPEPQECVIDETDLAQAWQAQDPQELVQRFSPLVRRIALGFASRGMSGLDIEDLTSAGMIGLLGAFARYDPTRATKFWTFAEYRIRGKMLDELRAMDWVPRSVRARNDQIRQATNQFIQKEGRLPEGEELAAALGISVEELESSAAKETSILSLDDPVGFDEDAFTLRDVVCDQEQVDPCTACISSEMNGALRTAMTTLTERQQDVVRRYYFQGSTLKEIGEVLGLTESGVCRIHAEALRRLRGRLTDWEQGVVPEHPEATERRSRGRQKRRQERKEH